MGPTQKLEWPGRIGIQGIGLDLEGFGTAHELSLTRGFIGERSPPHQIPLQLLGIALPVTGLDFKQPVVVKTLLNPCEVFGAFAVGIGPLGCWIHRAAEMGSAAIAVIQRQLAKT